MAESDWLHLDLVQLRDMVSDREAILVLTPAALLRRVVGHLERAQDRMPPSATTGQET